MAHLRIGVDDLVIPTPGASVTTVDAHLVVLQPRQANGVLLNASAALIYTAFDGVLSIAEVVDQLVAETGTARSLIEGDVRATVARLVAAGVVHIADPVPEGSQAVQLSSVESTGTGTGDVAGASRSSDHWRPAVERLLAGVAWSMERPSVALAGTACRVRANAPEVAALLEPLLAPLLDAGATPAPHTLSVVTRRVRDEARHRVVLDGRVVARAPTPEAAAVHALHHLDLLAVECTDGALLFHAGAVERDGRVVIVLGISGKGKSTVTAALVQQGFRYLSDEVVAVDAACLEVRPYPKALDLDETSIGLLGLAGPDGSLGSQKFKLLPATLGVVSSGGRPALMVVLAETLTDPEPGRAPVEVVPPAEALLALLPVTFEHTMADPAHFDVMAGLCERVVTIRVGRAPLPAMVATIEAALAR